jgi:polysaccharide transporter, PST family
MPQSLKRVSTNAIWIITASLVQRLVPFLVIPLLTRRLGHESFGDYVAAVAVSAIVTQFVEYGFNLSATRKIAFLSSIGSQELARVLGGVVVCRFAIACLVVVLLAVLRQFESFFIVDPWTFWSSVALGIVIGSDLRFMFYGAQTVGYLMVYSVGYAVLSTLAIYFYVHDSATLWLAFALPAIVATAFLMFSISLLDPKARALTFSLNEAISSLKDSTPAFLQRGLVQANSNLSPLILGFFATPAGVGYFGIAERLLRQAALFGLNPAQSTMVPHISALETTNARTATRDFLIVCGILLGGAFLGGVIVFFMAPTLAWVFFGPDSDSVVRPFRILCFSPFLLVLTQFGCALWLFFIGRQHTNTVITISYCVVSVLMLLVGSSLGGYIGACYAVMAAQIMLAFFYLIYFYFARIAPWQSPLGCVLLKSNSNTVKKI